MPVYSYRCANCQSEFKENHPMTERLTDCEVWGLSDTLVRLPSEFAFFRKEKKEKQVGSLVEEYIESNKEDLKKYPKTVEKDDDPGSFVWDEFVGMWVACLPLSYIESSFLWLLISFFLFRLFDIWKPLGIRTFDKGQGAFNVMIDDVIAGVYSAVSMIFLFTFFNYI